MNVKAAAQVIRDTVTMDRILDLYGYRSRHGFMCCPFHGEKEPSLKVYGGKKGWHCFGCERGGSAIDFVMEHENCDFRTAVKAIDHALNLGLMDPHENPAEERRQQNLQKSLDDFVSAIYAYVDALIGQIEHQQLRDTRRMMALEDTKAEDVQKLTADDYTFLLTWKEESQFIDYQIDKVNEFKEEVAAWRRKARRAR